MLLIYTQKVTPRIRYIFRQICTHILGVPIEFTSKIETFVAYKDAKMSYGKQPLGNELFIESADLLFQTGFTTFTIEVSSWEDSSCFFKSLNSRTALPYDIFAASFYLLSRYEEYFPKEKDEFNRFQASESLAYKNNFLKDPVVDVWTLRFKKVLLNHFPDLLFTSQRFRTIPIVSVSEAFAYKEKGMLRSLGGILKDLSGFRLRRINTRFKVLLGFKKDPYNTFDYILSLQKADRKKLVLLFGLGAYSSFEKSIGANKLRYRSLIKAVADYAEVGLRVSYAAIADRVQLKKEKKLLENITHRPLKQTICSYYKLNLPETYRNMVEMEITEDYSMGYPSNAGFRAGTCSPFLFYDLNFEVQTPLWVHSFCFTHAAFRKIQDVSKAKEVVQHLMTKVARVDGIFIPVFTNGLFVATKRGVFWRALFEFIWKNKEL